MAFTRYFNDHVKEYFTNQDEEDLYQTIMNGSPSIVSQVRARYEANLKIKPSLVYTTYYRIAKKALEIKEEMFAPRTELQFEPLCLPQRPLEASSPIDEFRPFPKGSLADELSVWYVKNRLTMQMVDGFARMLGA